MSAVRQRHERKQGPIILDGWVAFRTYPVFDFWSSSMVEVHHAEDGREIVRDSHGLLCHLSAGDFIVLTRNQAPERLAVFSYGGSTLYLQDQRMH